MGTIFIVFKTNFKRAFNEKRKFLISLFLPVLAIILAILVNSIGTPKISIGVVEKIDFPEGNRIIALLQETKGLRVKRTDEKFVKTDVILGKYSVAIILRQEFQKGEDLDLEKYFDFYAIKDKKLEYGMKELIKQYLASDNKINIDKLNNELKQGTLSKTAQIIAFLATVLLMTSVINGSVIIKDKTENTLQRFIYSPNRKIQYILGNILYNFIFSYVQLLLALLIISFTEIKINLPIDIFLVYGLILVLVNTTFGVFIACMFNKELYANIFASSISLLLSLIGGTFIPYDMLPKGFQIISNITPNRWIIKSIEWLENGNISTVNPIFILVSFSILFSIGAAIISNIEKVQY